MKKILLIAVGLMLSAVIGCAAVDDAADKAKTIAAHIHTLKTEGCQAVPESARKILVVLIKSRIENYPKNGICNPNWVRDVLVNNLILLESSNVIQDRSKAVGHSANSRHRRLDQSDSFGLLLSADGTDNYSTGRVRYRSGIDTKDSPFIHASSIETYTSGGGDSRLHIQETLLAVYEKAGRHGDSRGDGSCSLPGANVEAQCGLLGGSNRRQG